MKVWAAETLRPVRPAEDPLLTGGPSEALERYRTARAALAELDVKEREGQLVPVGVYVPAMTHLAGILRRAGHRLVREFGNGAGEILNEAIDEFERQAPELLERAERQRFGEELAGAF